MPPSARKVLAIPVIKGRKTDKEKFAGAEATYTIESLMHDGKALQSGTSHNFGDGFAKAFGIQYTDKDNTLQYVHQTSWGMTTRMIGALIMVHGGQQRLVLPPRIAPVQLMVIPHPPGCRRSYGQSSGDSGSHPRRRHRVKLDQTEKSPGWKFLRAEMRGIPLRIELGPKDIEQGTGCPGPQRHQRKICNAHRRAARQSSGAAGRDPGQPVQPRPWSTGTLILTM